MKKLILLFTLVISFSTSAQHYHWVGGFGSTTQDEPNSVITDAAGNVYATGFFSGPTDFDPGAGTLNLISIASLPAAAQKEKLSEAFDQWKGPLEQVDDVTIVGIRI